MTGPRFLVVRDLTRGTVVGERIESAESFWGRFMGLMGRPALRAAEGMWLTGNGIHMLFMRFAIDCVFVGRLSPSGDGRTGRVVAVRRALPPWRGVIWYVRGAHGVIELPVGAIDAARVAVGDEIVLEPA